MCYFSSFPRDASSSSRPSNGIWATDVGASAVLAGTGPVIRHPQSFDGYRLRAAAGHTDRRKEETAETSRSTSTRSFVGLPRAASPTQPRGWRVSDLLRAVTVKRARTLYSRLRPCVHRLTADVQMGPDQPKRLSLPR
jgi:hypothetical protein